MNSFKELATPNYTYSHIQEVPEEIKERRVQQMIELSEKLANDYAAKYENTVVEVIPEEKSSSKSGSLVGYSDNYLKVQFDGPEELIGSIVRVKITKAGYPINEGTFVKVMDDVLIS